MSGLRSGLYQPRRVWLRSQEQAGFRSREDAGEYLQALWRDGIMTGEMDPAIEYVGGKLPYIITVSR